MAELIISYFLVQSLILIFDNKFTVDTPFLLLRKGQIMLRDEWSVADFIWGRHG